MKGKVRFAKKKDSKRITELCNSDPKNLTGDGKTNYDKEDIEDYIKNKLNKIFVYEMNGKLVGLLIAQFWENYVYLHTIVVDEKHRKKEIGKILMSHMERLAKEQGKYTISLFSEIRNKNMHNFIQKRGYKEGNKFIYYSKK